MSTKNKEMFNKLSACNTELEVQAVINSYPYLKDSENWLPLGKNKNNASIVQNTAGSLGSCLVELTTNAIDAVIQREKNEHEKDGKVIPEKNLINPDAFLKYVLGETYTDEKKLDVYAHNSLKMLTTEADQGKRSLTVVDWGCGQVAKNFDVTFCSVGSGNINKANKSWLHGNYGQGSTSANAISGRLGYKIIVSRENITQQWGFTIVRRSPQDPSMLEYLITDNGDNVLEFDAKKIEMGYRVTGQIAEGEATLEYGSAIKLFDVKFEKGFTGIKRTMGSVLFRPALPIKSIEFSQANEKGGKKNGRDSRWIYGLGKELDKMEKQGKAILQIFAINVPEFGGQAFGRAYFIPKAEHRKEILEWFPTLYIEKAKRIFHINNGQVQHTDQGNKIGQFFPKAQDAIFVEMDLSNFDTKLAKAYLWKADRTSCQTSNEYFQIYDKLLDSYFSSSEDFKAWALICKNDELEKLKGAKNESNNDNNKSLFSLYSSRKTAQYNATKKLMESENNSLNSFVRGKFSIVENDESDESKIIVVGKEIPTVFTSNHNIKVNAKKSTFEKMTIKMNTDALKGAVSSKNGKSKLQIKTATVINGNEEKKLHIENMNMSLTENNGSIKCEFIPNQEMKTTLKVGDVICIQLELSTSKEGQEYIVNDSVFFEIIEELQEVNKVVKKPTANHLASVILQKYGTIGGREYVGSPTADLSIQEDFDVNAGYFTHHDDGKISVFINLDNAEFNLNLRNYKEEDKKTFMSNWTSGLLMHVIAKYNREVLKEVPDLEAMVKSLNDSENSVLANDIAIKFSAFNLKKVEEVLEGAVKQFAGQAA